MNEQNIFERMKKSQPEIKNKNYIKNNIISAGRKEKRSVFTENSILICAFTLTVFLLKNNITLDFYPGQDIYNTVSVNIFVPVFFVSAVISLIGSAVAGFFNKIIGN